MKSASRIAILFLVLLCGTLFITGCQSGPKHDYPVTIEDAKKLEAKEPDKALDEYTDVRIKLDGKDREKAAEALWLGIQFASDPTRYGTAQQVGQNSPTDTLTPEMRKQIDERQGKGQNLAHEMLKEMLKDTYKGTKVYAAVTAPDANGLTFKQKLEEQIDTRNAKQWNYKLVDGLIKMTGSNPWFSYWFALIIIALTVKAITFPLMMKTYKSQREMQRLQPAIKALTEKYKGGDQAELQKRIMDFYKEHGVNPFATCIPLLVQMPFIYWMFYTIRLYEFHFTHGKILWIGSPLVKLYPDWIASNMGQFDMPLLIIYTASMWLSMKMTPATDPQAAQQQQSMSIMSTGMMFFFFIQWRLASAFTFYWLIQNILTAVQSYYFVYRKNRLDPVIPVPMPTDVMDKGGKSDSEKPAKKITSDKPIALTTAGTTTDPPRRPRRRKR